MISEHEVAGLLRAASDDVDVAPAPARELAAAGARRRRRHRVSVGVVGAAVVVLLPVAVWAAHPFQQAGQDGAVTGPTSTPPAGSCVDVVPRRVLPEWARTGFSDPEPRASYVRGDRGDIGAILFAQPLAAPPADDHNNKILWASPYGDGSSLRITATLADGSAPVTREVEGGPGPSIVDLPRPGCWHLTLRWAGRTDTLDLAYAGS